VQQYERYRPPVRFVEKVLSNSEMYARTVVHFPFPPTLSMLAEAGAQTSIFARRLLRRSVDISAIWRIFL